MIPIVGNGEAEESDDGVCEEEGKRKAVGSKSCELEDLNVHLMMGEVAEDSFVEFMRGEDAMLVIVGVGRGT